MEANVFFGASFASPFEVEQAILHGLDTQLLWGSDYPHLEGTFVNLDDARDAVGDAARAAQHVLRGSGRRDPADGGRERHRGLQPRRRCAPSSRREIDAPTLDDLATPIDAVPAGASLAAFRSGRAGGAEATLFLLCRRIRVACRTP